MSRPADIIFDDGGRRCHRVLKAGSIRFGDGVINCTVLDISEAGAVLEVAIPLHTADRFKLIVQSDGLVSRPRDLRSKAAAHDVAGARRAWLAARAGWERSEVFTSDLVPELDSQIDA